MSPTDAAVARHNAKLREALDDLADLIEQAETVPPLVLPELARVLRIGAAKHGCVPHETGGGQTVRDHLDHAAEHLRRAMARPSNRDAETGALDLVHAMARIGLAAQMVLEGGEAGE